MYEITNEKFIRNTTNSSGQRTALSLVHIVCDTSADMPEPLPHWISGSRCDVLEHNGSVYLLSNSRQWEQVNFYNQGGGGEGDTSPLTPAQMNSLLNLLN